MSEPRSSSLPYRQLRKARADHVRSAEGSLPYRQLRNTSTHTTTPALVFTAVQAA